VNARFSDNIATLEPSATLALAARAKALRAEGRSVIDLSAGEPVFSTPGYAAEAGIAAIRAGRVGYPPTPGTPELRQAVARYLDETTAGAGIGPNQVLISAGVKQALFNCAFCLFQNGDEVIVPAPLWPSYTAIIELAGATPVVVPTRWEDGFALDLDVLEAARGDNTRGIMINSPSNPSGATYGTDTLRAVLEWTDRNDLWLLSDEIYRRLYYEGPAAPSVLDIPGRHGRVVALDGISKAFAMTGWRIGFAAGPEELIAKAADLQSQTTSGAAVPSQAAAAAAYSRATEREAWIVRFVDELKGNRDAGVRMLSEIEGIEISVPPGGIYLFARLSDGSASLPVAERLLNEAEVACIPGEPFGSPGFLRFNFAVPRETLETGLTRVVEFFSRA
jgi:aspartate aminotransferase